MGKLIPLPMSSRSGTGITNTVYTTPVVEYVNDERLKVLSPYSAGGETQIIETRGTKEWVYTTPVKPDDIEILRNPTTTDYGLLGRKQVAVGANAHDQTSTTVLKQYNEITTATTTTADAAKLPAAPVANDTVCVINNHATVTILVFPAVGGFINSQAVNTSYSVLPGKRVFFVFNGTTWKTAVDNGR